MHDTEPAARQRPEMDARLAVLAARRERLAIEGRRNLYMDSLLHGVYQWSKGSTSFAPETGATAAPEHERICLGDHNCRVSVGRPFPYAASMPSVTGAHAHDPLNWARDYEFFLAHSPAKINPCERIVGEFHWQLDEARRLQYPASIDPYGERAMALGAGGSSFTHTCPDLSIGLTLGWRGVRAKIAAARQRFSADADILLYLDAADRVARAIIQHIRAYSERARALARAAPTASAAGEYDDIAAVCDAIAEHPPATFREAVQWIQFYQICERINGHGNGYGRLDLLLQPFYEADLEAGRVTPELARDLVAEFFLKYGGNYISVGGRNRELRDATQAMSWICLRAYDMVGGYNCMGVLWHADIDPDFYRYACDVVCRHRCGTPALLNYDLMRQSEIYSGVRAEDAWNVSYSGCQWYCIVGKEYCDQDKNVIVLVQCLKRALDDAARGDPGGFDTFYAALLKEIDTAADALIELKNQEHAFQPRVWPEIVTSFMMADCIEQGRDVTDSGTGHYGFTSVNLLGFTNVVDSLMVLQRLVYERGEVTLQQLRDAAEADFAGREGLRRLLLDQPKFGNDDDAVDAMARRFADDIERRLRRRKNGKGYHLRPSLFQFMGHALAGPLLGAGIDGRRAEEPFAQGFNPMHGRNVEGITATANSLLKIDQQRFIGAPWQCELSPAFFRSAGDPGDRLLRLSTAYFRDGGMHLNANIIAPEDLEEAMVKPESHQNLMIKVTGYAAHFVKLDGHYQREIVRRTRQRA